MLRQTKIVATLGPASSTPEMLDKLIAAGVDVVRLNFSHGKAQDHIDRATMVREAAQRAGKAVAIMADLQAEYDQIADSLRAQGAGTHEGRMFKAVVSEEALTTTFDAAAAKAKLLEVGVAQSWIDGNVKVSVRKASVSVRAR